jgi:predicted ATPase/class 3 adenylate cyclase
LEVRELPRGTVTLLFTDIEGSTRMLQELGRERYVLALTAHRRLLREAFTAHGGVEVEMQGDSFHFSFPYARDAVAAAVAGQRALQEHVWESQPISVRIGLHTGEPIQAEGLYAGLDVHWAARVMSAGHGGQVLVSQRTAELVDGELAAEIELLDLGEHRLKDLTAPQRLYQAIAAGLKADFPPLKTLGTSRTNLPVAASPLIGREREVSEVSTLVANGSRVVTVTGAGGSGKTRLALQAAAELVDRFAGGVFWIPLAALKDWELVVPTIAETLGVANESDLRRHLGERPTLLLLDNFEHLLDAADSLSQLLSGSSATRALVTSRAPLQIEGEHEYPLDPLPDADAATLFVERSRAAGRTLVGDALVEQICRRLDSLPLAIELAAARTKVLSPEALLERLEHRLPLLTGGRRDAPERHRTLRATIGWSCDLLDEPARELFARLSVFAGDFSLGAAEAICSAGLDDLQALVDWSLLKPIGHGRFLMLETVREYAEEQLDRRADAHEFRRHRTHWFAALAYELAVPARRSEPQALEALQLDQQNFRAAFADAVDRELSDDAYRLLIGVWFFLAIRGHARELEQWARLVVDLRPGEDIGVRGEALAMAAEAFRLRADNVLGIRFKREAIPLLQAAGKEATVAAVLADIACMAAVEGRLDEAEGLAQDALAIRKRLGVPVGIAHARSALAEVAFWRRDFRRAIELQKPDLELLRSSGLLADEAICLGNLGAWYRRLDLLEEAASYLQRALEATSALGDLSLLMDTIVEIAALALRREDEVAAARLLGGAERLRDELGFPLYDVADYQENLGALRARLAPEELDRHWQEGAALERSELVEEALHSVRIP